MGSEVDDGVTRVVTIYRENALKRIDTIPQAGRLERLLRRVVKTKPDMHALSSLELDYTKHQYMCGGCNLVLATKPKKCPECHYKKSELVGFVPTQS